MGRKTTREVLFGGPGGELQKPNLKADIVAGCAEFVAMTIFIFLALGGVQGALESALGPRVSASQIQSVAFSFGSSVTVGLFMCCPFSEGALNTAVLLSLVLCRKVNWLRGIIMFFAELAGAILGAYFANFVTANELQGVNALNPGFNYAQGFFAELLLTCVLCIVVLFVIVDNQFSSPSYNPFVVGVTLFMVHIVGTPIDGTSVNPARSFGPAIVTGKWANHWIFWFGPLIGSFFAYLIYAAFKVAENALQVIDYEKDEFLAQNAHQTGMSPVNQPVGSVPAQSPNNYPINDTANNRVGNQPV